MMSKSKRYLFTMWDGGGTVPPELCLARKLVARGHSVQVLGDPTIEEEARAAGCGFSPWTTAPHRISRSREHDLIRDYEMKNPMTMISFLMREFLGGPAPRWVSDTLGELERRPADVLVADFSLPTTLIAAEKLHVKSVSVVPNIWMIPTPGIPPLGPGLMPARGPLGRMRDAVMRGIMRRVFDKALPPINAARAAHGLDPVPWAHDQMLRADRMLVLTSPTFDITSPAMPSHVAYAGPQLDDPSWSAPWQSPWPADDTRPLVLVGLSSTFQDQVAVLRRVVDALSSMPVRALVTCGLAVSPEEVPGRDNVVVVRSAPHAVVLREAAVLVTHCGHGTAMKGLAAGVPLVCMPMGRDQNDTAVRVVLRGAGVRLKATATAATIRRAVEAMLEQPSYRGNARKLAEEIARGDGCVDPIAVLEEAAGRRRAC